MNKKQITRNASVALLGLAALAFASASQALVMDFGSGTAATVTPSTSYTEDGLTMSPLSTGSVGGSGHWDWYRDSGFATDADWHAAIHTGNNGEEVEFVFLGGVAFDLMSIYIEGYLPAGIPTIAGTLTTSAGGSTTVSTVGTHDFTSLTGFSNITWAKFSMPLGVGNCNNETCTTLAFDDVTFQQYVPPEGSTPAPATLALLGLGMAGIGYKRRKQNKST